MLEKLYEFFFGDQLRKHLVLISAFLIGHILSIPLFGLVTIPQHLLFMLMLSLALIFPLIFLYDKIFTETSRPHSPYEANKLITIDKPPETGSESLLQPFEKFNSLPTIPVRSGWLGSWQLATKRLIDLCGSAVLLIALAPIFALVALLIKIDSSGPIIFKQERVGLNMKRFKLFKFRTMVEAADTQQLLLESVNEVAGPVFKIKHDPRVTRFGRFLRRYNIDELPQLFNVLRGEMSLVGPRPLPVRDIERLDRPWHIRRLNMKPGVTSLWAVNMRSNASFEHWVLMDLEYIDHWSLSLDLKILWRALLQIRAHSGNY